METLNVKDKSQPIKITLMIIGLVLFGVFLFGGSKNLGGISFDNPSYSSATNSVVSCSGATSTVLLAASVGRTSFELTGSSTAAVTLCKSAAGCTFGSGLIIQADEYWSQNDGYTGDYSCIGQGATSTLHIIYSN